MTATPQASRTGDAAPQGERRLRAPRRLPKRLLGLDIGSDVVYAAALRRVGRRAVVDTTLALDVPDAVRGDDEALGQWLGDALAAAGLAHWPCVITLPRRVVVMKPMTLPPGSEADRLRMVGFQAEKMLPFPLQQAYADYAPGPGDRADGLVLCAAKAADVARWAGIAERAGLTVVGVKANPMPYARAVVQHCAADQDGAVAVVYLGEDEAEIAIVRGAELMQDRGVRLPRAQGHDDPSWRAKLMEELYRSLTAFSAEGRPVSRLLLCGQGRRTAAEADALAFELNVDVGVVDAGRGAALMRLMERDAAASAPAESGAVRAVAAAAEALASPAGSLDLLRSRFRLTLSEAKSRRTRRRIVAGLAAVAMLGLPYAALWYRCQRRDALTIELDALRPAAGELDKMRRTARFYSSWRERRPNWLAILRELSSEDVMPYGIYVVSLTCKEVQDRKRGGASTFEVTLTGRTNNDKLVHDTLIPKLRASALFASVQVDQILPLAAGKGRAFRLTATVAGFGPHRAPDGPRPSQHPTR